MKPLLILTVFLIIASCKKDPIITDCGVLGDCQSNAVGDTTEAYLKIIGTWQHQANTWNAKPGKGISCDKNNVYTLIFKSNKTVDTFVNGILKRTDNYTIFKTHPLTLSSIILYGKLSLCDKYLTVINSDVDGFDFHYTRIK